MRRSSVKQLLTFCLGGFIGFVVDAGVLQILVVLLHWDRYSARLISFLCAATATWIFNRSVTFKGPRRQKIVVEWMQYVFAMSWGFACNFAAYSALVYFFNLDKQWLVLAVGLGSLAGLGVNYTASRYWVFRHPKKPSDE